MTDGLVGAWEIKEHRITLGGGIVLILAVSTRNTCVVSITCSVCITCIVCITCVTQRAVVDHTGRW